MNDTIFALATAPGRAAVAVIRLSGPHSAAALGGLGVGAPPPRRASLRSLKGPAGEVLDESLVLWMPGPGSFTGEDCAELHLHGGVAVVDAVSERLVELGLRGAEPGEFTRRAFENGKLDLVQAEAVADLVDAETEAQRRQALSQLAGDVSARHQAWRLALIDILAQLEAAVDFPDEELPEDLAARTHPQIIALRDELLAASEDRRGESVREGFRIALVGPPNAGKSSLFNALLGRDAAIVTDVPGTTRDVIEAPMVLAGRKIVMADLAGLRDTDDVIEREGVRRARAWADAADLRLHLSPSMGFSASDVNLHAKADLDRNPDALNVSALTGEGIAALSSLLKSRVLAATAGDGAPIATRERHRIALGAAARNLTEALAELSAPELAAERVRLASRDLERLSGRVDAEAVLDRVFSSFCIGK